MLVFGFGLQASYSSFSLADDVLEIQDYCYAITSCHPWPG